MNILALSAFLNTFLVSLIGVFVYFRKERKKVNRIFLFFCLFLAIWQLSYGTWQILDGENKSLGLIRIISISSTLSSLLFLHLVIIFLGLKKYKDKFLKLIYFLSFLFLGAVFSPFFVSGMREYSFSVWPQAGLGATLNIVWGLLMAIFTFWLLWQAHCKAEQEQEKQIAYFMLGFTILCIAGLFSLPQWYGISLYPYGNFLVFLYPLVTGFAIIKYHLFRIRVILTEILVILMGSILFFLPFLIPIESLRLLVIFLFLMFLVFGSLLINAVHREIERREEMEGLAHKLTNAYKSIEVLSQMKADFLKIVNHQLRTPVSIIKGLSSMLAEGSIPEDKRAEYTEKLYIASERLGTILDDVLTAQKLIGGRVDVDLSPCNIKSLIQNTLDRFRSLAKKKGLNIVLQAPNDAPLALLDKQKIERILSRLIDNAVLYTREGGIKVTLLIKKRQRKKFFRIKIRDSGIGLSEEEKEKLFELFYRGEKATSSHPNGSGLGLFIVKKLVEIHKGRIKAESTGRGDGTAFIIEIPFVRPV